MSLFGVLGLFIVSFVYINFALAEDGIELTDVVNTKHGSVRGKTVRLATNKSIDQFLGIPFAKSNRFEAPTEPDRWNVTLNATSNGKMCPQVFSDTQDISEDCLFLNVYRPSRSRNKSLPVMHWIHGGGLVFGSATQPDSSILASEGDVIVVASNYRLGALGFLATGEEGFKGNYGMLDQVAAIRWVQENIHSFGGDPGNVTLFGESAGSISVSLLMLSPLTNGMYKNVILQSGAAVSMISTLEMNEARERAREFGEFFHCQDISHLKSCLSKRNFTELVEAQLKMKRLTLFRPFTAVIDGYFLPDSPSNLLKSGKFNCSNVLIGVTRDEGGRYMLVGVPGVIDPIPDIRQGMSSETFTGLVANNTWIRNQNKAVIDSISFQYTDWNNQSSPYATRQSYQELLSDSSMKAPAILTAQSLATANCTTYFYQLEHAMTNASFGVVPQWMAVFHGADLDFVFGSPLKEKGIMHNDTEVRFSRNTIRLWSNFAKMGNPTPDNNPVEWPRYTGDTQKYLVLKPNFVVKSKLLADKMVFWNEFLPKEAEKVKPTMKTATTAEESTDKVVVGLTVGIAIVGAMVLILLIVIVCLMLRRKREGKLKLEY